MRDVRTMLFDMEEDVYATVELLRAIDVMGRLGSHRLHCLSREDCEGLARVSGLALKHAENVRQAWRELCEPASGAEAA